MIESVLSAYLTHKADKLGYHPQVILAGRRINDGMGKVWVDGPDGSWEIYAVLADSDDFGQSSVKVDDETDDSLCCASVPEAEARCCG